MNDESSKRLVKARYIVGLVYRVNDDHRLLVLFLK